MQDEAFNEKIRGAVNGELWEAKMQGCVSRVTALALPDDLAWPCLLHKNVVNSLLPLSEPTCALKESSPFLEHRWFPWLHLPGPRRACHKGRRNVWSTGCFIKPERDLHVPLDQRNLDLLDCLEPILLLFQCAANLVRGNGPLAPFLPVSSSSEVFLRRAQMLLFWHPKYLWNIHFFYSIFSISSVL